MPRPPRRLRVARRHWQVMIIMTDVLPAFLCCFIVCAAIAMPKESSRPVQLRYQV
jgi:hypothetical protein